MHALLLVDIQNDFLPGGALPVKEGDQVIEVANRLMPHFPLVVASQDWHPADHISFASQHPERGVADVVEWGGQSQRLWPEHCVQNTPGAELAAALRVDMIEHFVWKGSDRDIDSYSALYDNAHRRTTGLASYLRGRDVDALYVMGLATDFCVRYTVEDALAEGFAVTVIEDGCRGVELNPGDSRRALDAMITAGAGVTSSGELLQGGFLNKAREDES